MYRHLLKARYLYGKYIKKCPKEKRRRDIELHNKK